MHQLVNIIPIAVLSLVVVLVLVYVYFPKIPGVHFTSLLSCPKCGNRFEYNWLPGGSLDAVRWGKYRFMRCPKCNQWSWFDVWSTRVGAD